MNIQDWFPLGRTGWISVQSKGLSRVFSNESTLCIRWPKYWSFSFSISPSNEPPGLISFRMDWLNLLAVQGTLKCLLQHHTSKASILRRSAFFTVQLSHPYMTTRKTIALTRQTFVGKVMSLLFNMLSRLVITFQKKCSVDINNCFSWVNWVTQSGPTLCNPMDCSTPGLPVHHQLPEFAQTHVHKSVIPSNHLILCRPLLLPPSIFSSIRVFSNESVLCIRWPKYWSFSFSISPSNEYSGLISFRVDWLDLLAVQGTLKSLLQHHSSKASVFQASAFFIFQLSYPYMTTGKNHSFE